MTSSRYPHITDELLSAYIDNTVTEDEKALIEAAISNESAIAWRLETLRYTVNLLNALPSVALPRSFVLSEIQMAHGVSQPAMVAQTVPHSATPRLTQRDQVGLGGFWQGWRDFWQVGNLFLRNAAAASLAIFLVLSVSNVFVASGTSSSRQSARPVQSSVTTLAYSAEVTPTENVQTATDRVLAQLATPTLAQSQPVIPQATSAPAEASLPSPTNSDAVSGSSANKAMVTLAGNAKALPPSAQAGDKPRGKIGGGEDQSMPSVAPSDATEFAPEAPSIAAASVSQPVNQPRQNEPQTMLSSTSEITVNTAENSVNGTSSPGIAITNTAAMTQSLTLTTTAQTTITQATTMQMMTALTTTTLPTKVQTAITQAITSTGATKLQSVQDPKATTIEPSNVQPSTPPGASSAEARQTSHIAPLQLAQIGFALITLIFAFLWWRSRLAARQMVRE